MFAVVSVALVCFVQERGVLGFERHYHVTDPFIRRLGLEAELQVSEQFKEQTELLVVQLPTERPAHGSVSVLYGIDTDYLVS